VAGENVAVTDESGERSTSWEDWLRRHATTPQPEESREEYVERKKREEVAEQIDEYGQRGHLPDPVLVAVLDRFYQAVGNAFSELGRRLSRRPRGGDAPR